MISLYLMFLLSFFLLLIGGEILVRGAVQAATRFKISTLVVGMTVVSFATSSPELFVSLNSVHQGITDITFGNVIGSNIANIALVLGLTAIVFRINISRDTQYYYYPMMLLTSIMLGLFLYFFGEINIYIGIFFVTILLLFSYLLISQSRKSAKDMSGMKGQNDMSSPNLLFSLFYILLGVLFLYFGSDLMIDSTIKIAKNIGFLDERIISVSVIAIGTSIPELATSLVAAFKKEENLAVGNLIGSNIFNVLAVLGITAIFTPVQLSNMQSSFLEHPLFFDFIMMMIVSLLLGVFLYLTSKLQLDRKEGVILLSSYLLFLYLLF